MGFSVGCGGGGRRGAVERRGQTSERELADESAGPPELGLVRRGVASTWTKAEGNYMRSTKRINLSRVASNRLVGKQTAFEVNHLCSHRILI